jgi:hypothetical protein
MEYLELLIVPMMCVGLMYAFMVYQLLPRRVRPTSGDPQESSDVLSWSFDAQMVRSHRRKYVQDFPPARITIDKQQGKITFENCYLPKSARAGKPLDHFTCDLDDIRGVYIGLGHELAVPLGRGFGTTVLTPHGRASMPDCHELPCKRDEQAIRNCLARFSQKHAKSEIHRVPAFQHIVLMSILCAGLLVVLIVMVAVL